MTTNAGKFDYKDARRYKHTRIGVWDLYEERRTRIRTSPILKACAQIIQSAPLLVRIFKDVLGIRRCSVLLSAYLVVSGLASLIPAVSLWYSGQLLRLVETAMETRTVDTTVLVHFAVARLICTVAMRFLGYLRDSISSSLRLYIKQSYNERLFRSVVRLDLTAFAFTMTYRADTMNEIDWGYWNNSVWDTINTLTDIAMTLSRLLSQLSVLSTVMWEQQDVVGSLDWTATTTNADFACMKGLTNFVTGSSYRQELVAGNLSEHISARFREASQRIGRNMVEFPLLKQFRSLKDCLSITFIIKETMHVLPQVVFTLHVVKNPMKTPLSLASLIWITHAFNPSADIDVLSFNTLSLANHVPRIHAVYEIENMQNKVVDGTEPFPENQQSLANGISVEFRNVSFQYPGRDRCALRNVSFKIEAGQLCVVVGVNGSGKSTILKLISRIYDPTEGTILVDGRDIKAFRLADLRAAMSILFQDYSEFPLSMRDNIGLGNPDLAHDDDKIREAARLGGAEDFIDEFPDGFDTYLSHPVYDYISATRFEGPMRWGFSDAVPVSKTPYLEISRGQAQRLAISRTFMRSLVSETESSAGMLLFDEPSASLDPTAEYSALPCLFEIPI
ncbi:P-loop containing nucleoside triphosphate hydrolase protein [Suillus bovinus]|uniref:P-loop containing nucleoside triphosphate hydrolase protein n=1 Tax=Suillus bovinus TaxID=48563 RepID=UPI001B8755FE|nr:P-loop containing nucleoside triphosphate hydrolase protein [Suillus bovinus]KAG2157762.1 P-loop containing nucleoside triphosphate hydrolase protein [Suillus bovinus]